MKSRSPKIMIIRHAEKPQGGLSGVTETGAQDKHDLIVRGWQRAGALATFFAPGRGKLQDSRLAQPDFLFASAASNTGGDADEESKSLRPQHTIGPLSQKLNLQIDLTFSKGQEIEIADAARKSKGAVLISWQHEVIFKIANAILQSSTTAPQNWPGDRFDVVYVFTLGHDKKYKFDQVPQFLLAGDKSVSIA